MQDDEKMFSIGFGLFVGVMCLTALLQVCYREQNRDVKRIINATEVVKHELEIAETRFSALSSADSLRNSVKNVHPKAAIVSYDKTVHIDEIPMVEQ